MRLERCFADMQENEIRVKSANTRFCLGYSIQPSRASMTIASTHLSSYHTAYLQSSRNHNTSRIARRIASSVKNASATLARKRHKMGGAEVVEVAFNVSVAPPVLNMQQQP